MPEINLQDFFKYYKETPEQQEGVQLLQSSMPASLLKNDSAWVIQYRAQPEKPDVTNPLEVPYQSQNDNISGTGYRECFSSSCAMVAMFYGKIKNDDEYNKVRAQYGDSTDAQAQIRALRSLGLNAEFNTNGNADTLKDQIALGRPTPCGWLHKGPVSSPSGGGHYSVVCGFNDAEQFFYMNDPNGEANLSSGGYTNNLNGKMLHYSYKNWLPRWECDGPSTGWYMDIWPKK